MILKMGKPHENKEDEGLKHLLHEHRLRRHEAQGPYKCNGCKQPGSKRCYKCPEDICDFYLHVDCFQTRYEHETYHPRMEECVFVFCSNPPSVADKYCDACGLDILGFRYECSKHVENPHDLHPTCANLESDMVWKGLKLKLCDKVESKCLYCGQRYPAEECVGFTGWKWVSEDRRCGFPFCFSSRKICYHVKCMYEMTAPKEKKFDEI